ncbi:GNAT family N-acetyltransferase [Sediminicoccus sp. KRV36]|uniref:GNAT family N-acetyltransferase n=1 Tax=Sediminicoccus sp. KRV36 TaxID=3133721 RepID=UPI00200EB79F|nr:GNAT family N-acetyltransferase [Sediminicoccus rosea]UPY39258.1 GNAT family N-acetyltransferase [Sediminicoccus rosea]
MSLRHGLEIRAATAAEAPGLAILLAEAGLLIEARDLAERITALRQGSATALVALQWGPPSGLVLMHWYPTLAAASPVAQITCLLVGEEQRRMGIGRLLLKGAAQAARVAGCTRMEIAAAAESPSLQAFCRATGFVEAGPGFSRSLRKQG